MPHQVGHKNSDSSVNIVCNTLSDHLMPPDLMYCPFKTLLSIYPVSTIDHVALWIFIDISLI